MLSYIMVLSSNVMAMYSRPTLYIRKTISIFNTVLGFCGASCFAEALGMCLDGLCLKTAERSGTVEWWSLPNFLHGVLRGLNEGVYPK